MREAIGPLSDLEEFRDAGLLKLEVSEGLFWGQFGGFGLGFEVGAVPASKMLLGILDGEPLRFCQKGKRAFSSNIAGKAFEKALGGMKRELVLPATFWAIADERRTGVFQFNKFPDCPLKVSGVLNMVFHRHGFLPAKRMFGGQGLWVEILEMFAAANGSATEGLLFVLLQQGEDALPVVKNAVVDFRVSEEAFHAEVPQGCAPFAREFLCFFFRDPITETLIGSVERLSKQAEDGVQFLVHLVERGFRNQIEVDWRHGFLVWVWFDST